MSYLLSLLTAPNLSTVAVFLLVLLFLLQLRQQDTNLPPGPKGLPFIGNLLMLLNPDKRGLFRSLHEQYGNLVSLSVGQKYIILVSGLETLRHVFVEKGKEFGSRPQVFTTLKVGQGKGVVNSSGETWKEHRAFMLSNMNDLGVGKSRFQQNILNELPHFLKVLENTGGMDFNPVYVIQTLVSNVICAISFGQSFQYDDPDFKEMLEIFDKNMSISGSTAMVNYFPFLEYLPGDIFKCRKVLANVDKVQVILKRWISRHQNTPDHLKKLDIIDRYIREMTDKRLKRENTTMDDSQLLKFVGDLLVAGTETTATTIRWGLMFLVHNMEVQRRIREEIVSTLDGREFLDWEDKLNMPYTQATLLEMQRLGDIAPFCLPHSNMEPVKLGKYVIPAGSVVIPNLNSIHHDPLIWPDPQKFKPERFLDDEGEVANHKEFMPYFIGTRMCPGRSLANMELFLILTAILNHFEVHPATTGLPELSGVVGITYVPHHHNLRFINRIINIKAS